MNRRYSILVLFLTWLVDSGYAEEILEEKLSEHFSSRGLHGCFVLLNGTTGDTHLWNRERAGQRFRPASTFKVLNAIIGLETKVVRDLDEVIPFGGTKELVPTWEKDMNLRDAMRVSNVAVFHQLARRQGLPAIKRFATEFSYGNAMVGDDIGRRFWLEGPLEISAIEQVSFLKKLAQRELDIRQEINVAIRELIHFDSTGDIRIYAKTGWVGPEDPQVGWWVGWVEAKQTVYPFALNIDIKTAADAKERIPIGLECLRSLGVIDVEEGCR